MINQTEAANAFVQARQEEVSSTKAALIKAAEHLLSQIGNTVFTAEEVAQAKSLCRNGDIQGIFSLFRPRASVFVSADHSGVFWAWIDAAGFLFDAIGTCWRYMTEERRSSALQWSKEAAQHVMEASYAK